MSTKQLFTGATMLPINTCWKPGPAKGNDPLQRDAVSVGDRFLVLVHCTNRGTQKNRADAQAYDFWDAHVIVATETGWDDANGESWSAWDWSDVSWYMELTRDTMPQLQ